MRDAIAYSAIDEGTRPFGDTGIRAMFDDANELGEALKAADVSKTLKDAAGAVSKVLVQYAGQLAIGNVLSAVSSEALAGVLKLSSDKSTLAIDFSDPAWLIGRPTLPDTIVGRKDLTDVVFRTAGFSAIGSPNNDIRTGMKWLWNDDDSKVIDRVVFATKDGPQVATVADRTNSSTKVSLFATGGDADSITGSRDRDFLFGGAGNDTLKGGLGDDLLAGGTGDDRLSDGDGRNFLAGGEGKDTVFYDTSLVYSLFLKVKSVAPATVADVVALELDRGGGNVNRLVNIEKVELTDNEDRLTFTQKIEWLKSSVTIDGKDGPNSAKLDGRLGDRIDFSAYAAPALVGSASDGSAAEVFSSFSTTTQIGQWLFNLFVPTGEPTTTGVDASTGLRFTNFEHVVGSANSDVLGLWRLNPGGALTAAQEQQFRDARGIVVPFKSGDPGQIGALMDQRLAAARVVPQNQQDTVIEGGAGDDTIVGTRTGFDRIDGGAGNDVLVGGGLASELRGGAGDDTLEGNGFKTLMYGGEGTDLFKLSNHSFVMDATKEDNVWFDGFKLTGGVQLKWMESAWAYWTPFSSLLAGAGFGLTSGNLVAAVGILLDARTSASTFRYGLTTTGQLVVQYARGRGGQAVIDNYQLDLETGDATGHVVVFKQEYVPAGQGSIKGYYQYIDLALRAGFGACSTGTDPLVLDLDGDGIELTRRDAGVYFDVDNDGFGEKTAWVKPDDGLLARDINGNGKIDNQSELFGNATTTGFAALATLDSNGDGKITAADTAFGGLRVWRDLNSNGVTDAGELKTLAESGITQISLSSGTPTISVINGSTIRSTATFTRTDGTTSTIGDVVLDNSQVDSRWLGSSTVSTAAAALPNLKGYGNVADLAIAMTGDATLLNKVTTFKALAISTSWSSLKTSASDILFRWARVDTVAATALGGGVFDSQKLAFLESYFGQQLTPRDAGGNPGLTNLQELVNSWNDVLNKETIRLAVQGPLKSIFASLPYDATADRFFANSVTTLADAYKAAIAQLSPTVATAQTQWSTSWGPALAAYAQALVRLDANDIRTDYAVQSLLKALDGTTPVLSLQQLVQGLGLGGVQVGTAAADTMGRGTATGLQVYVAGAGNDTITGGDGQDVYVYGRNFGQDTINDPEGGGTLSGDRIRFALFNPADVTLKRVGIDLVIEVRGSTDKITIVGQFETPNPKLGGTIQYTGRGIEDIQFADGTIFEAGDIAAAVGRGTDLNDVIEGTGTADELEGLKGDDTLKGGDNGDTYYFTKGDGNDIIQDVMTNPLLNTADTLLLLGGITLEDTRFSRVGDSTDLKITFTSGTDSLVLKDQFAYSPLGFGTKYATDNRIEAIGFEQGSGLSWLDIQAVVIATYTTTGNDTTYGFGTDDQFFVSAGNDTLVGFDGGDTYRFDRGAGQDVIDDRSRYTASVAGGLVGYNWGANDVLLFGKGLLASDVTFKRVGAAPDLLISINGSPDTITIKEQFTGIKLDIFGILGIAWFGRVEEFRFDNGTVLTWEDVLRSVTTGTAASETLYGAFYQDTLDGKEGDDLLSGGDEGDTYLFGRGYGSDVIKDSQTNVLVTTPDTLKFAAGVAVSDVTFRRDGSTSDLLVTINGTSDLARIKGQYDVTETGVFGAVAFDQIERFVWADGTVKNWSTLQQDIIGAAKTAGDDVIIGTPFDNVLDGGNGNDRLEGQNGSDTYVFASGYGNDTINDNWTNILSGNDDRVNFGAGILPSDIRLSRYGAALENLRFDIGTTGNSLSVEGQFIYSPINYRSNEIETFSFTNGVVWTAVDVRVNYLLQQKTAGNDTITGFWSNDTLDGGAGDDVLRGGDGADTYRFATGFGNDKIEESVAIVSYDDTDTVEFLGALASSKALLSRTGDNLQIGFQGYTDQLTIVGQFGHLASFAGWQDIEIFKFGDGVTWTDAQVRDKLLTQAKTTGNDLITGFYTADILDGGAGNDTLRGLGGGDTYVFGRGSGQDVIEESIGSITENQADTIAFSSNVLQSDVTFQRSGNDLKILIAGATDTLTIKNQFTDQYAKVELFTFSTGITLTAAQVEAGTTQAQATLGNDVFSGSDFDETILSFAGDDSINARAGNDTLDGGTGNDTLIGGLGADTYIFGRGYGSDRIDEQGDYSYNAPSDTVSFKADVRPGDIQLSRSGADLILKIAGTTDQLTVSGHFTQLADGYYTRNHIENFVFADGTTWRAADVEARVLREMATSGNDTITAYDLNETLDGGAGNDTLIGGLGADTYIFGRGYGADRIDEQGDYSYNAPSDTVSFKADVRPGDIQLSRSGADLILKIAGTTDQLTVTGHFTQLADGYYTRNHIENFVFADGTTWRAADLEARVLREMATSGNDTITAYDLNETLDGGAGNDTMIGGLGADTYIFGRGYGADRIDEQGDYSYNAPSDTVSFKVGVGPGDIQLARAGADLILKIAGTTDQLTVTGHFTQLADGRYTRNHIESFVFADGTTWRAADVETRVLREMATSGNDTITAYDLDETLDGGAGNDTQIGGLGNDTYVFGRGYGADVIDEDGQSGTFAGGVDKVTFRSGVLSTDIGLSRVADDLVVKIAGTTDQLTIKMQLRSITVDDKYANNRIESFVFYDGTVWTAATIDQMLLQAGAGADTLVGYETDDIIAGLDGDDTLSGHAGNDTLRGGNGNDVLIGGAGADVLDGGAGWDTASYTDAPRVVVDRLTPSNNTGFAVGDTYISVERFILTSGADTFIGNADGEYVEGGAEADVIRTGDGNDTLVGGEGPDTLDGGNGWDTASYATATQSVVLDRLTPFNGARDAYGDVLVSIESIVLSNYDDRFMGNAESIYVFGGQGNDVLLAGAGNDWLFGGAGADVLNGGAGWDVAAYGDATTAVTVDLVTAANNTGDASGDTFANIERFSLSGFGDRFVGGAGADSVYGDAGDDTLIGNAGNDVLEGADGNDLLVGGAGADSLDGGAGFDTASYTDATAAFVLDRVTVANSTGDAAGDVFMSIEAFILGGFNDRFVGDASDETIYGGAGNDTLIGNSGNDVLDGGVGADVLTGGLGDDTYSVDNAGDVVTELTNEGTDTVVSSITYTLGANVENLTLTGLLTINGTGNTLNNTLIGNSADNILDGGAGSDTMKGGAGNDTYIVDVLGDVIVEQTNEGSDTVKAGISYVLGANLENLTLTGTGAINGTGNTADNVLLGNGAVNTLVGGDGNDTLDGGAGNDILTGGTGSDVFVFKTGYGKDTITEFIPGLAGTDVIALSLGTAFDTFAELYAAATQVGANTLLTFNASTTLTLNNVQKTQLVADDFRYN